MGNASIYVNPFIVLRNGQVTKHFYAGSQRIASKLTDNKDGLLQKMAGESKVKYTDKKAALQNSMAKTSAALGVEPIKVFNFQGEPGALPPGQGGMNPGNHNGGGNNGNGQGNGGSTTDPTQPTDPKLSEKFIFFYHPDHLGSSSYISDANGEVSQHLEYFAFGETFLEEHSNTSYTPYLFNGKELDDETGLYYYGARYYDAKTSVWQSVDPLAEQTPSISPYAYCLNNPVNMIDPDGRSATPPDDHFDSSGNFMYTDFRKTNNIVIHTGVVNFSQMNDEVQLKDFTFSESNYSTLSKISDHYAKSAGVDLDKVHNGKISVADEIITGHKGGQPEGYVDKYNDGTYSPKTLDGSEAIMTTDGSKVTIQLSNGKVHPLLNDANNFTSTLDHEGGKMGHLINPDKKHSDIYKDQIRKYSKTVTPEFNKLLKDNLEYYKNRKE